MRILGGDYLLVLLLVSGVILASVLCACFLNPGDPIRVNVAFFAAVALVWLSPVVVHIYAALWVKGTITAMVEGWHPVVAKKHHPRWY